MPELSLHSLSTLLYHGGNLTVCPSIGMRGPGNKGDKGKRGRKGRPGDKGPPGPKGVMGDIGDRGAKGAMGNNGSEGMMGPAGYIGEIGKFGDRGCSLVRTHHWPLDIIHATLHDIDINIHMNVHVMTTCFLYVGQVDGITT